MLYSRFATYLLGALDVSSWARSFKHHSPEAFDGQYTRPTPENGRSEWKFFQLIADAKDNNPPATLSVLFAQGYLLQTGPRDPTLPEYYLDVAGNFPNGTTFHLMIPAEFSKIKTRGQDVDGTWGTVARFEASKDSSIYTASFTAPQFGLEGTFKMVSDGKPHLMCNSTTDHTFSSAVPAGTELTPTEKYVYNEFGWLTPVPGGFASADITIEGTRLRFSGKGYHDSNYIPAPFNAAVDSWYAGSGPLGPYDFTYIFIKPINSTKVMAASYLSHDSVVLQQQCGVDGDGTRDVVAMSSYGLVADDPAGEAVPAGFVVQFTLLNGEAFRFNFTSESNRQLIDQVGFHRWLGRASGGKVGGTVYEGPFLYEWVSPTSTPYVPPPPST